mgnify:CR=1 FL=1
MKSLSKLIIPFFFSSFLTAQTTTIKADFNRDNIPDKMELVQKDKELNIFYHQNKGDNTYFKPLQFDTIQVPNGYNHTVKYNKDKNRNELLIKPYVPIRDGDGMNIKGTIALNLVT